MARVRHTIRWDKARELWILSRAGGLIGEGFTTKSVALFIGRKLCRENPPSQLVVYKRNGQIQTEYTYQNDPKRTKGYAPPRRKTR